MALPSVFAAEGIVDSLKAAVGNNLYSCCLYGSAVRGNAVEGVSDINLLIVLERSDVDAHLALSKVLDTLPNVDPFILGREGLDRSVKAFAAKFSSIKRNYRVLWGADPLADIEIGRSLEKFLCEQAVRNLRLRLVFAFVTRSRARASYGRFLTHSVTPLFLRLSEMMRLEDKVVPDDFAARADAFALEFGVDARVLHDLLALKSGPSPMIAAQESDWHARVFPILDAAVSWIERHWGTNNPFPEEPRL